MKTYNQLKEDFKESNKTLFLVAFKPFDREWQIYPLLDKMKGKVNKMHKQFEKSDGWINDDWVDWDSLNEKATLIYGAIPATHKKQDGVYKAIGFKPPYIDEIYFLTMNIEKQVKVKVLGVDEREIGG